MAYQPIEDYGVIGDLHTVALVGRNGSIDWLCFPRFDSPSLFAAVLDDRKGGRFRLCPTRDDAVCKQLYWPGTNVLVTRFLTPDGVGEIVDYMPVDEPGPWHGQHQLVRQVSVPRGTMKFRLECRPAFNYARDPHQVQACGSEGVSFHSKSLSVGLATRVPIHVDSAGGATSEFSLKEGEVATFLLEIIPTGTVCGRALHPEQAQKLFEHTVRYWRRWLARSNYRGRWREVVERSALALKLLTYEPTGAIVAAPTCSLPEHVGGSRNWDYRYTWIRDAAFTLYGLLRIGFTQEAAAFMNYLEARCHELEPDNALQIMYGIDGRHQLTEETLDHLEGYKGSRPVRIGNGAHAQRQLDIYGELMDSVYLYNKYGSPISYDLWKDLRRLLDWVCAHWQEPDHGVWEVRRGNQHFVYSKLMCWVALDRGLRLAEKRSFPADRERWLRCRDAIYQEVWEKGWSEKRQSFVQYYGSQALDAANLVMPLVFFLSPTDPRMLAMLDAVLRSPARGGLTADSLVYRYNVTEVDDGIEQDEGTFNMCSFWLVEALTRAGREDPRRLDKARLMFESMLGYANHLGLYAEETGPRGDALGNFPQAFTHLGLISAAFNLDRALSAGVHDWPGLAKGGPA